MLQQVNHSEPAERLSSSIGPAVAAMRVLRLAGGKRLNSSSQRQRTIPGRGPARYFESGQPLTLARGCGRRLQFERTPFASSQLVISRHELRIGKSTGHTRAKTPPIRHNRTKPSVRADWCGPFD
jgi:hypothetical protein